jgi:vitamin K-dependent gamma-carboxylase
LLQRLFEPVDISSLVYFRIAFGAMVLWQVWRYSANGWIERYFIAPVVHFTFYPFEWVRPWPGNGMYIHFFVLGVLALCIILGHWYRLATALFSLGYTYVFLLDPVHYQNHVYLLCLISLLMIFVPAHRALSLDAWRRPELRSATAPAWALWLLRVQVGIPYFYGGLAKLDDDWLRGEPLRMWLANRVGWNIVGPLFSQEWMAYLLSYGGLLLDLLIVPLLLWRRTRTAAFVVAVLFHLANAYLFRIGIFPWLMIAATALFFDPDWPRRLVNSVRSRKGHHLPRHDEPVKTAPSARVRRLSAAQRTTVALLAVYAGVQLLAPLRHYLYPGHVMWTEEGYLFAWRMKLRSKAADAQFFATDPATNETWQVDPAAYLARSTMEEVSRRPDLILQFSHHLADDLRRRGHENVEIRVKAMASLNGRPRQDMIDPTVNLAAQPRGLLPASWIVPLRYDLPISRRTV